MTQRRNGKPETKPFDPWKQAPKKLGAPSTYTPELAAEICRQLRAGRSLRSVCNDPEMPAFQTVFDWLHAHDDFHELYVRAKEASAIADAEDADHIRTLAAAGLIDANGAKVALDAIKWSSAHKQPRKFGRVLKLAGAEGGLPVPLRFSSLSDAQLNDFIQRLERVEDQGGADEGAEG